MKLSLKVITIFYVSVVAALSVMAAIGINFSIRQSTQHLKESADIALTSLSTTLSEDVGTAFAQIEELATHDAITALLATPEGDTRHRKALEQEVRNLLGQYAHFNAHYLYVYLGTQNGTILVNKPLNLPDGYTPVPRPWYAGALAHPGQPLINSIYKSLPDGYDMASISRSILSPSGEPLGVVGIDFLFSRYQQIMQNLAFQSGFIVITHNNASVIAHSRNPKAGFTRLTAPENADLRRANNAQNGHTVFIDGEQFTAYAKEIRPYKLKILTFVAESTLQKTRRSYIVLYASTAVVILLFVGITGARLARNTLRVEQASLKAKHDFFKNMNHEIRTPLNGVIGFVELLSSTPLNDTQKHYLGHTRTAAKHLAGIVNDVLDLSSIRAGKYRIVAQPYLVHDLIGHVVALVEQIIGKKPIRLHVSVAPGIPHALNGDGMRLKQVLLNILHNAVKFTDSGLIALRVGHRRTAKGRFYLEFAISDTGTGIRPEHLPQIFEEFTQFAGGDVQGTGLGLALTRQLVERMGGRITCTSTLGKGTRFGFHVVQSPVSAKPKASALPVSPPSVTSSRNFTAPQASVLLVEDDPISCAMMTELLKRHHITVHTVGTGQALLDAVQSIPSFHLILTDIKLPDIDGRDATKRLRALVPPADMPPVIAISSAGSISHMGQGPFDACLRKPVDIDLFQTTLLTWLPQAMILRSGTTPPASREAMDTAACEANYGRDLYLNLLRVFMEEHGKGVEIMAEMIESGRFSDLEVRVHRVKGALMNIGAHGAAKLAADLEERLEAGERPDTEDLAPLRLALATVMKEAQTHIGTMRTG